MNQEEYIEQRLDNQIKWYSAKSATNQKKHKYWQVIKIISALLITTLSIVVDKFREITIVIGVLGAFVVFVESFVKIFDYEKLWLQYRTTSERLKREKLLFQTKSKPYHGEDSFALLVQQCEAIMQNEVQGWVELVGEKE
ncbi:DUF4231 domain-containing protein [Subsaximicrobium wynnwilliamsii]|uniref:DUF4231 domain-containing protein n=1 Tax=Subsaximicrobium wynnwilliamsii TaxID=291179 RepID=A0A5C6ZEU0_9FLAO|nr:DUF4231 domain-containing protein [Subsaximicrobium wynnwilliamsii]TXD83220.1 DUF4231 domain-containing protein [Subsaximicrobium wynnwilliamsii]TXD88332.1 DUF4231 domain-containing protein [Subsaximicrobium wynnwilliamsii]TXE03053.1 DUF4231 domain-containing protein [Subsaximicrobium wynnwilliamsii]